jgi:hypothetical protein
VDTHAARPFELGELDDLRQLATVNVWSMRTYT